MNDRERFLNIMHFKSVDRVPFCEFMGFWHETINRWYKEGLPTNVGLWSYQAAEGMGNPPTVYEYFGFDKIGGELRAESCTGEIAIDFGPIPRFVKKTLKEDARYRVEVDEAGITKKVIKTNVSMPGWIDFPVKSYEDFETMKKRFNPDDSMRYPKNWSDELIEHYKNTEYPIGVGFSGFFAQLRLFMGLERLLINFYKEPEFIHEMLDFWSIFIIETLKRAVESAKVDYANIWEDMGYKKGPHISPNIFRKFFIPYYKKVTEFLRNNGVDIIMVNSDGNIEALIPLLLETGVNCLYPLEANAGMEAVALREKYGKRLSLIGNIDKMALSSGKKAMERELECKLPTLIDKGGYIPSVDHNVPQNVPLKNYVYYMSLLKKYLGMA